MAQRWIQRSGNQEALSRWAQYRRYLAVLRGRGRTIVSLPRLAEITGVPEAGVREDLLALGFAARRQERFEVNDLLLLAERVLGDRRQQDAFLLGVGQLGSALLSVQPLERYGVDIIAGFDPDPALANTEVGGRVVLGLDKLASLAQRLNVKVGVVAVPAVHTQAAVTSLIEVGMTSIWVCRGPRPKVNKGVVLEYSKALAAGTQALLLCPGLGSSSAWQEGAHHVAG